MPFTTKTDFETRALARLAAVDAVFDAPLRTDYDLNPEWPAPERPVIRPPPCWLGLSNVGMILACCLPFAQRPWPRMPGRSPFPAAGSSQAKPRFRLRCVKHTRRWASRPTPSAYWGRATPTSQGTGFAVAPFVGILPSDFVPVPHAREVADVFETPLSFLMDSANHERHEREFRGALRAYYAMPHNGRYIWGATAGMIKALYDRLYGA